MSLLAHCDFPAPGTRVDLAVSGGPDSLGLLALALESRLSVTVHHVDHHARPTSADDAAFVREACERLGVPCVVHDVRLDSHANFEAMARAQRRRVLPEGILTGHTMDDLVETVLLNMMRGAGLEGMSPMVGDPTKPLRNLRRHQLHSYVVAAGWAPRRDETNDSDRFRRNRVRRELLVLMDDIAQRDVVPLVARQAHLVAEERAWLDELSREDLRRGLGEVDCRELREWPSARLRRWLRARLSTRTVHDEVYPPSANEVARALAVVRGEVVACELSGGRRLSRRAQRLTLE